MRDVRKAPADFAELENVSVDSLDVRDETSIYGAVARSEDRSGAVDVLINVAAYPLTGSLEETSIDQIRDQFETNLFGLLAVTKAVLPGMRRRGVGHVVNFSSAAGLVPMPSVAAYTSSKFAVEGYSEALAGDLAHLGVRVTIVEPGAFSTKLGDNGTAPLHAIDAYASSRDVLPTIFDFTPGDLEAASEAVVSISGRLDAPLRLYVGHGLDSVRRHYQRQLDGWTAYEHITATTL
jgi:short-subunit dehydrogenase